MIELFAELITKRSKIDFSALIEKSMQNDIYLRDNAPIKFAKAEELHGTELFYRIDDDYACIKKELYFSYFVHKILLSMKRFYKKQDYSHVVLLCESESEMMHILEDQIFRIISQIQDQEYRVTEKSPVSFTGKHTIRREEKEGYRLVELTLPRYGVISLVVFYPALRSRTLDSTAIVQNLLEDMHEEDVTHFYKLDSAFKEKRTGTRGESVETCKRILEEGMPEDCIHYTFIGKRLMLGDSYASRNAERFALQLNEKNFSLMRVLIQEMHKNKAVEILGSGYILDPISSPYENLKLCKADQYSFLLEELSEKKVSEPVSTGIIRGQRAQHLWVDETRAPSYILGADTSRGQDMRSITVMRPRIPEGDTDQYIRELQQLAINSMNAQIEPMFRYDRDGDAVPIRSTNPRAEIMETRNQATYSFDTMQAAVRSFSEDQARRMDRSIRDEFLRNWIDEQ